MLTVKQAAKKLRVSAGRVRQLLVAKRVVGAQKFGRDWAIPDSPVIDPPLKVEHRPKGGKK